MAINPETQYPGKIAPSSPSYPYGQARNITVPGDGTGTPWEAALVNDLFGWQQAILKAAGEVPSGTPETATASQYLTAMSNLGLPRFESLATFVLNSRDVGDSVQIIGYYGGWAASIAGPRGGHLRHKTGATNSAPTVGAPVPVSTIGSGDQIGYCWDANGDEWLISDIKNGVNVLSLGAYTDGASDSSPAFQGAVNLSKLVIVPGLSTTEYIFNSTVDMAEGVRVTGGAGRDRARIRANGISAFNSNGFSQWTIENLRIYSDRTTDTWGITVYNAPRGVYISNVYCDGFGDVDGGGGFKLDFECWGSVLNRVAAERCGYGVHMVACSACTIINPAIRKLARSGVRYDGGVGNKIIGGVIEKTWGAEGAVSGTGYSIYVNGGGYLHISGVYTEQSIDGLIKIKDHIGCTIESCFIDGFSGVLLDGLVSFENSQHCALKRSKLEGLFSGIGPNPKTLVYIDSNCESIEVVNNNLEPDGATGGYDVIIDDGQYSVIANNSGPNPVSGRTTFETDYTKSPLFKLPGAHYDSGGATFTQEATFSADAPGIQDVIDLGNANSDAGVNGVAMHSVGSSSSRQTRLRIETNNFTRTPRWIWSIENDGEGIADVFYVGKAYIGPALDNTYSAGNAPFRYSEVFAANGTINTSDERDKTELLAIEDSEKACALEIKSSIAKFQMLDAVEKKGADGARIHFGVGAQTVRDIFSKHGLDPERYALFCYDEWDEQIGEVVVKPATYDDEGNELTPIEYGEGVIKEAGGRYGIRYDQLAMFVLAAL